MLKRIALFIMFAAVLSGCQSQMAPSGSIQDQQLQPADTNLVEQVAVDVEEATNTVELATNIVEAAANEAVEAAEKARKAEESRIRAEEMAEAEAEAERRKAERERQKAAEAAKKAEEDGAGEAMEAPPAETNLTTTAEEESN